MRVRFVCLANSYKEGGRCIAGIEIDAQDNPVIAHGHPKWIRPISGINHGEVAAQLVAHINILDVVEIIVTGKPDLSFQSENVFFNEEHVKAVGKFPIDNLKGLCWDRPTIFGNKGKAVHVDNIEMLAYSLMFIRISDFVATEGVNEKSGKNKTRLEFSYNNHKYDLTVTDPLFLNQYGANRHLLDGVRDLFVCASLGVEWEGWHHKIIAGIIVKK